MSVNVNGLYLGVNITIHQFLAWVYFPGDTLY